MKLKLQNVGGIINEAIELKEGLNVIRAPNAVGKTSLTHGLKLVSMNNQQLRNHPEFINDFTDKAFVEIDGKKRVIEKKGLSPMSSTEPIFRLNGKENIIFAMPENDFLNSVIKGEPIDKFLESFSDAQYFKELIERDGILKEVKDELDEKYGELNTEAKNAQSLRKNIEKENKDLEKLEKEKIKVLDNLDKIKHKVKMNKEEEGRLSQLRDDIETIEKEIQDKKGKIKSLSSDITFKAMELKDCKEAMERFQKEFKNIDDTIKKMNDEKDKLSDKLQDEDDKGLYDELNKIDAEISSTESNIEGNKCISCGRNFTKQQQKDRLKTLNKTKDGFDKEIRNTESELEKLTKEISTIKDRRKAEEYDNKQLISSLDSEIRNSKDNIQTYNNEIERKNNDLKKKKEAMDLVKEKVDPQIKKFLEEDEKLSIKINAVRSNLSEYKEDYELVEDSEKEVLIIKARYEFIKRVEVLIKEELTNLKNIVKNNFNKKIMTVYNKLGFKDFKNIEIDSTFRIIVTRKNKIQELNRLSTSERVTLGVIVMLVGKEEYLPEYPFFVMDEVTTAYDPVRFKKIIDYIVNETQTTYTIVTAFSPTGDRIKVEHKL